MGVVDVRTNGRRRAPSVLVDGMGLEEETGVLAMAAGLLCAAARAANPF